MDNATKWAGRLIVFYSAAHTLGALTALGAANYVGDWFSGQLWREGFTNMSPANSALWLSLNSFGIPLLVIGLLVIWLDRRGLKPPLFVVSIIGVWTFVDAIILLFTPWPLMALATILLLVGSCRSGRADPDYE